MLFRSRGIQFFEYVFENLKRRNEETEQNSHESRHQNRKKCNEINRLALFVNGAGHAIVVEYPVIAKRTFSVQWKREVFNLSQKKLATLRERHGWTNKELAEHSGVSVSTIKVYLYAIDRSVKRKKGKT
jgi:hypothetical protein